MTNNPPASRALFRAPRRFPDADFGFATFSANPVRPVADKFFGKARFEISAQLNIGAAARHIGGDGDGAGAASLRDDRRFLIMETRVQNIMRNICVSSRQAGKAFRFFDRNGADQNGLAARAAFFDAFHDRFVLFASVP